VIDIVIVSNSDKGILRSVTEMAIRTARQNAGTKIGKIVIVEQCRIAKPYPDTKMLYYDFEFNYNQCLNLGFSVCESQYVAFCNNDLYFEKDWAKNAIDAMQGYGYLSVCPTPKHQFRGVREGYTVGKRGEITGWCIIMDREVMERIHWFDCPVKFWYSDNVYACQLQKAGIKHAMVGNSYVRHLESVSIKKLANKRKRAEMMKGQEKLFNEYKKNVDSSTKIETKESKGNGG